MNKIYRAFVVVGAFMLLFANVASAAELMAPAEKESNLTVGATETHHNLYAGATTLIINGNTTGDAFLAGSTVTENGNVEMDQVAAGSTVVINGTTGGDIRVAGQTVTINAPVAGDLLAAAGTLNISEKSSVGGDFLAVGGDVNISAPVTGSVKINAGKVTINSKITGNVYITAGEQLILGSKADIAGQVYFTGPKPAQLEQGAAVPNISYTQSKKDGLGKKAVNGLLTGALLIKLLGWFLALFILIKLFPTKSAMVIGIAQTRPWASLGVGFAMLVATPLAILILFLTFVGYYVALILLALYVMMLIFAGLYGALFGGNLIVKWLMKKEGPVLDWQSALIGVAVVMVLGFIPFVGWLAGAMLFLIGFGSLVIKLKQESYQ